MSDLAPDLLSPEAHKHETHDRYTKIIERRFFRDRQIAAKWTPRDYAIQHVRSYILTGWKPADIMTMDGCHGHIYADVSSGRTCAGLPPGKLRVKMWNRPAEIFSTREIIEEVQRGLRQRTLF